MKYPEITVSEIDIRLVNHHRTDGLIGWASCVINNAVKLDNINIRKSRDGTVILSYPFKKSKSDVKYYYFVPVSYRAGKIIEQAILERFNFRDLQSDI